jgi:hypothetical protein
MKIYSIIVNNAEFDVSPSYLHHESFHTREEAENKVRELAETFIKDYSEAAGYNPYSYDADNLEVASETETVVSYIIDWTEID